MFDESFINLRPLQSPMNLGMSFLGSVKFLLKSIPNHSVGIEHWGSGVYWSSVSALLCAQVLHHGHQLDSTLLVDMCCPDLGIYPCLSSNRA